MALNLAIININVSSHQKSRACESVVRHRLFDCLFVSLSLSCHNSKMNDPKVFKLLIKNDLVIWFGG